MTTKETARVHQGEDGSIYIIRDVFVDPDGCEYRYYAKEFNGKGVKFSRCEYATLAHDVGNSWTLSWTACSEGVSFSDIKPFINGNGSGDLGALQVGAA